MKQRKKHNAGLKSYLRLVIGAFCFSLLWGVVAALFYSSYFGAFVFIMSLFVLPVIAAPLTWFWMKRSQRVSQINWSMNQVLARSYFESIVQNSGLRVVAYSYASSDQFIFHFHSLASGEEVLVFSTAMLKAAPLELNKKWDSLWQEILNESVSKRRLRTLQICFWFGVSLPAQFLTLILYVLFRVLGFKNFPVPAFWLQPFFARIYRYWFGRSSATSQWLSFLLHQDKQEIKSPAYYRSLLWAPWVNK